MKKTIWFVVEMVTLFTILAVSTAAQGVGNANGINVLNCFSGVSDEAGFNGTCALGDKAAAKQSAILNTVDGDTEPGNNYAGLYSTDNKFVYGKSLSAIAGLRFTYTGTVAGAGSPRFSIGIDNNGDGLADLFAYAGAYSCSDGNGNVLVSASNCRIYTSIGGGPYAGSTGLAAAYPHAVVASDVFVFIVADEPGVWTITDVSFGGPGNSRK